MPEKCPLTPSLISTYNFLAKCWFILSFQQSVLIGRKFYFSAKFCLSPHQCCLIGKNLGGWKAKFFPGPHQCIWIGKILSGWIAKFFCQLKPTFSSDFSPLMSALENKGNFIFYSFRIKLCLLFLPYKYILSWKMPNSQKFFPHSSEPLN